MTKHYIPPARHRWFDDWRGAKGPALRKLVADITAEVEALETRTRKRKAVDQARFETAVEVVVSNLAHEVIAPSETGRLAILTGNGAAGATRYDNRALGKPFASIVGSLFVLDLAEWRKPQSAFREASSLAPMEPFRKRVQEAGISLSDIGRVPGEETIILSQKVRSSTTPGETPQRRLVNYPETATTTLMRGDMEGLNAFLEAADISFIDDESGMVDTTNRNMRRHFIHPAGPDGVEPTYRFDLSGRLFGGFWQAMKSERRNAIRINGEPVAELDYGQMGVRLAYAHIGASPPDGDMYAIPGLEGHRPAVKKALNVLLNDSHRRNSWPSSLTEAGEEEDPASILPEGWSVGKLRGAILVRHPDLRPCLGGGIGLKLMHTESEILVAVLKEMMERGIVGLGIHDGLLTPTSRADEVRTIMEEMAASKAGATIPVSIERLSM